MRLLFDTHAFLWWHGERAKLSAQVVGLIEDPQNDVFLSHSSIWEIQIKHHLGKLKLTRPLAEIIEMEQQENRIELLPSKTAYFLELYSLPLHHRDPFDRLLIAQARVENAVLLSDDSLIALYPVQRLW